MLASDDPLRRDLRQIDAIREVPFILDVCRQATGMRFVAVARVTDIRWIACATVDHLGFGLLPGDELAVSSTICDEVRACGEVIAIEDVDASERFRDHPTPARYGFKSYLSVPVVRTDGSVWGTLCALDPVPRRITPQTVTTFRLFTQLIALELDRQDELEEGRAALAAERATGRLREEFLAVVGHDLRNPLAAITAGLRLLGRGPSPEDAAQLMAGMQRSALRMQQILDNLADFARGRLGAGIALTHLQSVPLEPVIRGVAGEIEQVSGRWIQLALDLPRPVRCDPLRIGQLLSNLLANAVTHGAPEGPIRVAAQARGGGLRLSVTNTGAPIPPQVQALLFQPFVRGGHAGHGGAPGLGLGLYIADQIARAHGGTLEVTSDLQGTTFTLILPEESTADPSQEPLGPELGTQATSS
ncbi:ATP-binding protein [Rubellimicrobium aerolatum]|uniref:histidine kinase n=1 Tax=Rubellimicrobium aerolatum TaxID=490979 RepID=A0ABW0SDJ8_9RHOB